MEKYYIVIYKTNWADEFDLESFQLFSEKEWLEATDGIDRSSEEEYEISFGTNEYVITYPKEFFKEITVTELSLSRYNMIMNIIGESFGTVSITNVLEHFKYE